MNTKAIEQHGFRLAGQINETSRTIALKAVQTALDRTVILRILKPEAAADPLSLDLFLKIARSVARIKSDGLAAVFDIVSDGALHYVVTEHVDGPTIEELVDRQGPLPVEQILKIAWSIAQAIGQLWSSERIVHRNLKSATIRLDARGIAKITDFSLAVMADDVEYAYSLDEGHIVGTPCFLSPEQVQRSGALTTFSDMYALGAVCYHMATGQAPFEGQEVVAILNAQLHGELPPPHLLNPRIPEDISWFVRRLMMKAPELRYRTWEDAVDDIIRMLDGQTPLCVCAYDTSASTITSFVESDEEPDGQSGPRIRLRRNRKLLGLDAFQSKTITEEHAKDILRATRSKELLLWAGLALWLLLLLWYRAAYKTAPDAITEISVNVAGSTAAKAAAPSDHGAKNRTLDEPSRTPDTGEPLPDQDGAAEPAPPAAPGAEPGATARDQ